MYNVLWIDDQHNDPEMIQFAIEAANEGLILEGYESSEEGFIALENNLNDIPLQKLSSKETGIDFFNTVTPNL